MNYGKYFTEPRTAWFDGLGSFVPLDVWNESNDTVEWTQQSLLGNPDNAIAENNLGWALQVQGNFEEATRHYEMSILLDPALRIAKRNLSTLLIRTARKDEAIEIMCEELNHNPEGYTWMRNLLTQAMAEKDLSFASEYAAVLAELRWSSKWYHPRIKDYRLIPSQVPSELLTAPKLQHDSEQFAYLIQKGLIGKEFEKAATQYCVLAERIGLEGAHDQITPSVEEQTANSEVYNRIIHVRDTPRIIRALSRKWIPAEIEKEYIDVAPGIVTIDDFLTDEALENIRAFCLESTIWNGTRFSFGRLGAFFQDGFNCPLLIQIEEELRQSIPLILTPAYPLREIWGFKCSPTLPADATIHADFAAVNVNFWITPSEANTDEHSGGLVIYGLDAPHEWEWDTYNGRSDLIRSYLSQHGARPLTIPYRQNRAIIFNSDLFHATDQVNFRPGYENHRINITMLYGDRQNDQHHPVSKTVEQESAGSQVWRSAAFSHRRH